MVAGRAQPRRRMPVPFRVPQPVRHAPLQRRSASRATTSSTAAVGSRSSTSDWSSSSPTTRWRRSSAWSGPLPTNTMCRPSGASSRMPACCVVAHPPTTTRSATTSASSTRASRTTRSSRGRRSTPAGSFATRSIAPARSRNTRPCRAPFVFIQRINLGLVRAARRAAGNGQLPDGWPRSCGRSCRARRARRWPRPSSRGSRRDAAVTVRCPADRLLAQPSAQLAPAADRHRLGVDLDAAARSTSPRSVVACRGQQTHSFDIDAQAVQSFDQRMTPARSPRRRPRPVVPQSSAASRAAASAPSGVSGPTRTSTPSSGR